MIKVKKAIIVEGKYDKIKLSSMVDGIILETNGFRIFKDKLKLDLIKKLAEERGIIILTDSDSAGFIIRNYLNNVVKKGKVFNAYIPEVPGKERRKPKLSKEGKLGVEGIEFSVLEDAIIKSGALSTPLFYDNIKEKTQKVRAMFYEFGFYGGKYSDEKRNKLKKILNLPSYLTVNSIIKLLSMRFSEKEIEEILNENMTSSL